MSIRPPPSHFERICLIRTRPNGPVGDAARARLLRHGMDEVREVIFDETVVDPLVAVAWAHRQAVSAAMEAGTETLLVVQDECLLLRDFAAQLPLVVQELAGRQWALLHLGAALWGQSAQLLPGCRHLGQCDQGSGSFALAYHRGAMQRLLNDLPDDIPRMGDWVADNDSLDEYLARWPDRLFAVPALVSLPALLPYEDPATRATFA